MCAITSAQFSKLDRWIEERARQLRTVLHLGLTIYGEWLQAKHSVHYDALPEWFLVFDLLDLRSGCFLSVDARNRCLALVDLAAVPSIKVPEPRPTTPEQLLAYLETLSSRYRRDVAPPEGIVVRADHGPHHVGKAKLVNKWFIQTIESSGHWMHLAHLANQRLITDSHPLLEVELELASQAVGELLTQAVWDGRHGNYDNVLEACAKARLWMPYSPVAEILRAQALIGKKEWGRAVKSFKVCLQLVSLLEEEESANPTARARLLANANGAFAESMAQPRALQAKCRAGLKLCRQQQREGQPSPLPSLSASPAHDAAGGVAPLALASSQLQCGIGLPRKKYVVETEAGPVELMRNLSWLVPNQILAASTPKTDRHIDALHQALGISLVITLTEEEPLPKAWFKRGGIANVFEPMIDQGAPSLSQAFGIIKVR